MAQDKFPIQFGISMEADFQEDTWLFKMPVGQWWISSGKFAIVREDEYLKINSRLEAAEALIFSVIDNPAFEKLPPESQDAVRNWYKLKTNTL